MKASAVVMAMLGFAWVSASQAQPVSPKDDLETVIVTAPRLHLGVTPNAIAHDFVKSFATPTMLRDAIARWQVAVCPDFEGLAPQFVSVMQTRLRTIAGEAGARMKEKGCRANLSVIFTPQPQAYLDALRARNMDALGYHGAITVTHPIQAWYVTGITDVDGRTELDRDEAGAIENPCGGQFGRPACWSIPTSKVGGWRDHPDTTSDLLNVTIIVDAQKTGTYLVGEIADYVAMLALSRTEDYDDCQLVPSIANLMSPSCDDKLKPAEVTASDIAYLRGIYKMDAGAKLQIQQDQIAGEITKALEGR